MAEPRQARVLANLQDRSQGALLALQLEGHPDIVLRGGKYIILNTGISNAEGKVIKRAFSLFAVKPEAQQFFLAAESVEGGIASSFLKDLKPDETITFSGPWGRFHWPEGAAEKIVIAAAFGSGITGILGYLSSIPEDCQVQLYWFRDKDRALLSDNVLQECAQHANLQFFERSMQDDPLADLASWPLDGRYVAAGEGTRVECFLGAFRDRGVTEDRLQSEIFYRSLPG